MPREDRGALVVGELPPVDAHLEILADAGHGKSSHLLALAVRHPKAHYVYVPEGASTIDTTPVELLLLDEAQRVKPRLLRRLIRAGTVLVMGTHAPMADRLGVPVRRWPLPELDLPRLRAIVDRRIHYARGDGGPTFRVSDTTLKSLVECFGGNIRAIEDALYESVQCALEAGHVEV